MEIRYPKTQIQNPLAILRKAGYAPFRDPKTHEDSFTLRLTDGFYPRFHLYLNDHENEIAFSLHLDQKQPSYKGTRKHGGEYEGPTVEKEMKRIAGWITNETSATRKSEPDDDEPKKQGWFKNIFG